MVSAQGLVSVLSMASVFVLPIASTLSMLLAPSKDTVFHVELSLGSDSGTGGAIAPEPSADLADQGLTHYYTRISRVKGLIQWTSVFKARNFKSVKGNGKRR